jgi:hypothetical protein
VALEDGKIFHIHQLQALGETHVVKMAIGLKAIYILDAIPSKIPMTFYAKMEKKNPKIQKEVNKNPKETKQS